MAVSHVEWPKTKNVNYGSSHRASGYGVRRTCECIFASG